MPQGYRRVPIPYRVVSNDIKRKTINYGTRRRGKQIYSKTLCYDGRTVLIISSKWEPDMAVGNSDSTAASSETEQDQTGELSGTDDLWFLSLSHCINNESMIRYPHLGNRPPASSPYVTSPTGTGPTSASQCKTTHPHARIRSRLQQGQWKHRNFDRP